MTFETFDQENNDNEDNNNKDNDNKDNDNEDNKNDHGYNENRGANCDVRAILQFCDVLSNLGILRSCK